MRKARRVSSWSGRPERGREEVSGEEVERRRWACAKMCGIVEMLLGGVVAVSAGDCSRRFVGVERGVGRDA